jgi:O-antigen ligase
MQYKVVGYTASILLIALIALFTISAPFSGSIFVSAPYNTQRMLQVSLLCAVGMAIAVWFSLRAWSLWRNVNIATKSTNFLDISLSKAQLVLVAVGLLGLATAAIAPHPTEAMMEWSLWVLLAGVAMIVANATAHTEWHERVLAALVLCILLSLILYFFLFCINFLASLTTLDRIATNILWTFAFENQRFASAYQLLSLLLLFWVSTTDRLILRRFRLPSYVLAGFCIMLCAVSQGRANLVFLLCATASIWLYSRTLWRQWLFFLVISCVIAAALGYLFFYLPEHFGWRVEITDARTTVKAVVTSAYRDVLLQHALVAFWDSPILGIGPMQFADYIRVNVGSHPHNIYLQVLAEWGGITFVLIFGMVLVALRSLIALVRRLSQENHADARFAATLLATYAGIAGISLFDGLWVYPVTQVQLAVLIGLGGGLWLRHKRSDADNSLADNAVSTNTSVCCRLLASEKISVALKTTIAALYLMATCTLIYIVPSQHLYQNILMDDYAERNAGGGLTPRFWMLGRFTYYKNPFEPITKPAPADKGTTRTLTLPPASR